MQKKITTLEVIISTYLLSHVNTLKKKKLYLEQFLFCWSLQPHSLPV